MNVTVHTKTNCPWCDLAKEWLTERGFKFETIVHDDNQERLEFYEQIGNGVKSVPQIFIDGERIGGYQELIRSEIQYTKAIKFDADF